MRLLSSVWKTFIVLFFVGSLAVNAAFFLSQSAALLLSGLFQSVTGASSVLGRMSTSLRDKDAKLKATDARLNAARRTATQATQRVKSRTYKAALRSTASVPAEAIPFLGAAVVVSVTALDLYDACETMKDMQAFEQAFGTDTTEAAEADKTEKICGMDTPNFDDVVGWPRAGVEADWAEAQAKVPDLQEIETLFDDLGNTMLKWWWQSLPEGPSAGSE